MIILLQVLMESLHLSYIDTILFILDEGILSDIW